MSTIDLNDGEPSTPLPCAWCRRPLQVLSGRGRPRKYCKRSCRQRDFEARERAKAHGFDESEILVARARVDELRDHIFVLEYAVKDAERDLISASAVQDYRDILGSLLRAARDVTGSNSIA